MLEGNFLNQEIKNLEGLIALVYARVSSLSQDPNSQDFRCKQHAQQKGYPVEETFLDKFTGGGDFWKRPQMRRLLNYIDDAQNKDPNKKYVVIFDDLKRFARDTEFHIRLRKEFKSRDVKVECLNFNFEDSPEGKFVETVFAAQGELEREQNRRQVIQKQQARLERGYWVFDAPPGLKYIKDEIHGKILVPDEPKASIIREALNGFAFDRFPNQVDVQKFLESKGFYHRKKHKKVHMEQVKRILTRILYTDYIEYKPRGITLRKGHHKGLISLDLYQRIQDKLNGKAKAAARKDLHLDFPARGFVLCSVCHRPFTASWTTKRKGYRKAYYRCNKPGCYEKNKSISKEDLEGELGRILKKARPHKEVLDLTKEIATEIWNERTVGSREAQQESKNEIVNLGAEVERFVERISKTDNEVLINTYEKKIEELTHKKALLEERLSKPNLYSGADFETALNEVFGFVKSPYNVWENGIFEDKRLVLRMVFSQHLVYNRKNGFETAAFSLPITLFQLSGTSKSRLVDPRGIEPLSSGCKPDALPLSYGPIYRTDGRACAA